MEAGISSVQGKKDLALVVNNGPLDAAAGVFTSNRFCAAPVQWSRGIVADGKLKAVILNSGGANACTGEPGFAQSKKTAETVADLEAPQVVTCRMNSSGPVLVDGQDAPGEYEGLYFQGQKVTLEPRPDRDFSHWVVNGRELRQPRLELELAQDTQIRAVFLSVPPAP